MSGQSAPAGRAVFTLRTPDEVWPVAEQAAGPCAAGWTLEAALAELLANAIEHGSLEIGFTAKSALLEAGTLDAEIVRRLATPPWAQRRVRLVREVRPQGWAFEIEDEGPGFAWREWLVPAAARRAAPNGRGIALAAKLAGAGFEYLGRGNRVRLVVGRG